MNNRKVLQSFYKSKQWNDCRQSYLNSVGGLCERCKQDEKIVPAEVVHHKVYLDNNNYKDASISLNFDNLEALCMTCHNQEHFKINNNKKRWKYVEGKLNIFTDDPT